MSELLNRITGRSAKPNPTDWNPDDNQGKRKEQVDYSAALLFVCGIMVMLTVIAVGIIYIVNHF